MLWSAVIPLDLPTKAGTGNRNSTWNCIYLRILGEKTSPLKSTSGLRWPKERRALTKRAAPPTGSTLRGSTLYTSLKWRMVSELPWPAMLLDSWCSVRRPACRTSSDACNAIELCSAPSLPNVASSTCAIHPKKRGNLHSKILSLFYRYGVIWFFFKVSSIRTPVNAQET